MLGKIAALASKKRSKSSVDSLALDKPTATQSKMRWSLRKRGKALSGSDLHTMQQQTLDQVPLSSSTGNVAGVSNNGLQGKSGLMSSVSEVSSRRQSNDAASTVVEDEDRLHVTDASTRLNGDQPIVKYDDIFPSLSDTFLADNKLLALPSHATSPQEIHDLTEEQLKEKFDLLAMAFKSDSETMEHRLAAHLRNRTTTEQNARKEIFNIKDYSRALMAACSDYHSRELCTRLQSHIDILEYAIVRLSGKAELCGAAQQEMRLGRAVELMFQHVEGLQAKYKREHNDLQHMIKPLQGALERQNTHMADINPDSVKSPLPPDEKPERRQSEGSARSALAALDKNNNAQSTDKGEKKLQKAASATALLANAVKSSVGNGASPSSLKRRQTEPAVPGPAISKNPTGLLQRRMAATVKQHLSNSRRSRPSTCQRWLRLGMMAAIVVFVFLVLMVLTILVLPDDDIMIVPSHMMQDVENALTNKQTIASHRGTPS